MSELDSMMENAAVAHALISDPMFKLIPNITGVLEAIYHNWEYRDNPDSTFGVLICDELPGYNDERRTSLFQIWTYYIRRFISEVGKRKPWKKYIDPVLDDFHLQMQVIDGSWYFIGIHE